MPVNGNASSDEESASPAWGSGSIRQKIQMWESIEDITKKPPVIKKRPPLLYDAAVEVTQAHRQQTDTHQETKKQSDARQNEQKLGTQKPTHNKQKHEISTGITAQLNKNEDVKIKEHKSTKETTKQVRNEGTTKPQRKSKTPDVEQVAKLTKPQPKQRHIQQETTETRVSKRRSSKDRPKEHREVPVSQERTAVKAANLPLQEKPRGRVATSRGGQENGSFTSQHGAGTTDLHAPELVALLMEQPSSKTSQLQTEYTYEEQDDGDNYDDDSYVEDDDVTGLRHVVESGADGHKSANKRSEVFLTLTSNDTMVLDHIPEVGVSHAQEDPGWNVERQTEKNSYDRQESHLGLYPIDEYDSESTSATITVEDLPFVREYTKVKGIATMKAEPYDVKLAALLYLRGINNKIEFQLAANVEGAGSFGDIVFKYKTQNDDNEIVWRTCFIQLQCTETEGLTTDALKATEGTFSLDEDYKSYSEIASKMSTSNADYIFNGSLEDCSFVLYTNNTVAQRLGLRLRAAPPTGEIEKLIRSGFNDEFIFSLSEGRDKDIYSALGPDRNSFLTKLKVFSGQPSESYLDHMVKMELRSACSNYLSNVHIIYRFFIEAVQQWWLDDNHFLTQKINILDKAESILNVYNLTASQRMLFKLQDVSFQSTNLEQWKDEIRKGNSLLCIVTTGMTSKFSCTKLMQILWEENTEYIFTGLKSLLQQDKEVLREWMSGEKDMLVIVSESSEDQDDLCEDLCRVTRKKPHKQLVIISPPCDPFTTNVQLKYGAMYEELYDPFDLKQLDKESTDTILEKEVKFQGCPIFLRCIIGENVEKISKILTSENFDLILDNTMISIGNEMTGRFDKYIKRSFERCDVLKPDLLATDDFWGVIAVSNTTLDELQMLVSPGKKVGRAADPDSKDFRYLVLDSLYPDEEYVRLCETRKDVHWLHMMDDNMLLWKRSQRNITTLSTYKEDISSAYQPDHVLDLDDRVILVVADPRMGKTTLTTQLALETKQADPSMWVIKVHLNDCTAYLDEIACEEFNAVDFLSTVGLDTSKMDALDRDLLKFSVEELGNVAVFLDGFDAVVPRYLRKVLALLSSLVESKIRKIFITSQHGMKDMLETHLAIFAYKMCPDDRVKEVYV